MTKIKFVAWHKGVSAYSYANVLKSLPLLNAAAKIWCQASNVVNLKQGVKV